MSSGSENIKMLNDLLKVKYSLLERMLDITKLQSEAIDREDLAALNKLIEEKQNKIDDIDRIDEKFNMGFSRSKKQLNTLDTLETRELKQNTERILSIINDIIKFEKENNEKMHSSMDSYKVQMNNINVGKKAISIYNKPYTPSNSSIFIDRKK
ncbi:MAG: flagellar protein FlgN [Clostridiaceae bacterium]|jgi:hypothetical protein|nr:flagellar protein FlgN [Clostridiaceae bacterium]